VLSVKKEQFGFAYHITELGGIFFLTNL
jgi:hypothetical protein